MINKLWMIDFLIRRGWFYEGFYGRAYNFVKPNHILKYFPITNGYTMIFILKNKTMAIYP